MTAASLALLAVDLAQLIQAAEVTEEAALTLTQAVCCAATRQTGAPPDLGVVGMEKDGKQYVCTPYAPFGGAPMPAPLGASAEAPAGAALGADTSPLRFPDGSPLGLPAPAPEAATAASMATAAASATALADTARQYVKSFRAQQQTAAAGPAAGAGSATAPAQGPVLDPSLFANLLDGALLALLRPQFQPRTSSEGLHHPSLQAAAGGYKLDNANVAIVCALLE